MADEISSGGGNWAGAAASIAGSIGGSLIQAADSKVARKWQVEQNDIAYQRALDQWNRENAYNDPSAQRARLEAAGINPFVMNGTITSAGNSSGGLSSVPVPKEPSNNRFYPDPSAALDNALKLAQIRNIDADTSKKAGETLDPGLKSDNLRTSNQLLEQQIINTRTANDIQAFDLGLKIDLRSVTVQQAEQNLQQSSLTIRKVAADLLHQKQENALFPQRAALLDSQLLSMAKEQALLDVRTQAVARGIDLTDAQIDQVNASIDKTFAEKGLIETTTSLTSQTYRMRSYAADNPRLSFYMGTISSAANTAIKTLF